MAREFFEVERQLKPESLKRIEGLSSGSPGLMLPPHLDGRIVICELLNVFRSAIYSNLTWSARQILYQFM